MAELSGKLQVTLVFVIALVVGSLSCLPCSGASDTSQPTFTPGAMYVLWELHNQNDFSSLGMKLITYDMDTALGVASTPLIKNATFSVNNHLKFTLLLI